LHANVKNLQHATGCPEQHGQLPLAPVYM